jgi:hypothetical protein
MSEPLTTYFGDVLANFANGVQLDLRVKIALDLLKSGAFKDAEEALNQATNLLGVAASRGLVKDMPDNDDLSAPMKQHLRRSLRVQVYQQTQGPKIMAEETAHQLQPAAAILPGIGPNGRSRG